MDVWSPILYEFDYFLNHSGKYFKLKRIIIIISNIIRLFNYTNNSKQKDTNLWEIVIQMDFWTVFRLLFKSS